MIELMQQDMLIVAAVLLILAIGLMYRVVKGPHTIDKLLAADCIEIIISLVMVVYGAAAGRAIFVDLGLILALLGFIGSVLISKYMAGDL